MSQVEVLSSRAAIDFDFHFSDKIHSERILHPRTVTILSASLPKINSHEPRLDYDDDVRIPDLPPLLRGNPVIHLRNGVTRAARKVAEHEPDSEKAFFVADLSSVYMQHQRWKRCLPEIEPFYGASHHNLQTLVDD